MVKKVITSNEAVAIGVKLSKPQVIPVYPITPQTTISEKVAEYVADGEIDAEYIRVESEHSAMSASIGASGAGVRVFTATSSQGLMYMHEVVYAAAGMRTPIVMADANRAISAPLNIWNDHQDSLAQRDAGWIQLYVKNAQEALDTLIMAYKIAEHDDVCLPVMVCLDGFILTHTVEPVDIPDQETVNEFLPPYVPKYQFLDTEKPMSIGNFADPEVYTELRHDIQVALDNSMEVIKNVGKEFGEKFGREYGLIETYQTEDAEIILVAMGSIFGTLKATVDDLREEGEKIGIIRVKAYRPFPYEEIGEACKNAQKLAVLDKDVCFGVGGALYSDIKAKLDKETYGFILGLGGRDITKDTIRNVIEKTKNPVRDVNWIDLKEE